MLESFFFSIQFQYHFPLLFIGTIAIFSHPILQYVQWWRFRHSQQRAGYINIGIDDSGIAGVSLAFIAETALSLKNKAPVAEAKAWAMAVWQQ